MTILLVCVDVGSMIDVVDKIPNFKREQGVSREVNRRHQLRLSKH